MEIGYLPPNAQVKIVLEYVTEVVNEKDTDTMRFIIPTTIAPRYISSNDTSSIATKIADLKYTK